MCTAKGGSADGPGAGGARPRAGSAERPSAHPPPSVLRCRPLADGADPPADPSARTASPQCTRAPLCARVSAPLRLAPARAPCWFAAVCARTSAPAFARPLARSMPPMPAPAMSTLSGRSTVRIFGSSVALGRSIATMRGPEGLPRPRASRERASSGSAAGRCACMARDATPSPPSCRTARSTNVSAPPRRAAPLLRPLPSSQGCAKLASRSPILEVETGSPLAQRFLKARVHSQLGQHGG